MDEMQAGKIVAEVAVPVPLRHLLTYEVPDGLLERARPGSRALVQVGSRRMTGVIVSVGSPAETSTAKRLKQLIEVLDEKPLLSEELLSFVLRAADYYLCPPGEAVRAALPPSMSAAEKGGRMRKVRAEPPMVKCVRLADPLPGDPREELKRAPARARLLAQLPTDGSALPVSELRKGQPRAAQILKALAAGGWVEWEHRPPAPDPLLMPTVLENSEPKELTREQAAALASIIAALEGQSYRGILLHGVTGSGKTEVYIRAIEQALERGRSAVVLVPEIALTPQLISRFRARLGARIGVLHSGLTIAQRLREWTRIYTGEAPVAIGARSAIFAPVKDLGIIVVDEEHDPSFKQDEGFRYNGRDLAMLRAQRSGAVVVLGSATPSLETAFNAEEGRIDLLRLPYRVTPSPLPRVELVDLKRHRTGPGNQSLVSGPLVDSLTRTLAAGGQAILFLNRRGYAPVAICESCGEPVRCRSCSVSLTYHRRTGLLECHYCDHGQAPERRCESCGAESMTLIGAGTEQAEELLAELLGPDARVARLDSDVAPGRASEAILDRVRSGETNVLVGTQLVTKGHDLPGVSLVGVLLADASLHFPDFRATERTFQLLTQVAGRAGRGDVEGEVVIQTFNPGHPAIRFAAAHDYEAFYRFEMAARRELSYPPLSRLAAIRMSAREEPKVKAEAERIAAFAHRLPEVQRGQVSVLGPAPAPIEMVRGRYRYRLLLRGLDRQPLRRVLSQLVKPVDAVRGDIRASFDVDPVHLL